VKAPRFYFIFPPYPYPSPDEFFSNRLMTTLARAHSILRHKSPKTIHWKEHNVQLRRIDSTRYFFAPAGETKANTPKFPSLLAPTNKSKKEFDGERTNLIYLDGSTLKNSWKRWCPFRRRQHSRNFSVFQRHRILAFATKTRE
jgi:hypothetical protein